MQTIEITIQRKTEMAGWPVTIETSDTKTPLVVRNEGILNLDLLALRRQLTPHDYGKLLGQALFCGPVHDAFLRAYAKNDGHLSVLLFVEDTALRTLYWQRLCAPLDGHWNFLALNQSTPLTLYLPSAVDRRFPPIGRRDLRALIVVANPHGLERYQLAPFDADANVNSVRTALGKIPYDVLAATKDAVDLPSLNALCERLTATPYTLLHIICHGRYIANSADTVIYLADANNQVEPVQGVRLLERLVLLNGARMLPRFTFLATCESASPEAEGAMGGLAQQLVRELGMPAVLAMTERVSIETSRALAGSFYQRLQAHGEVDVALAEACAGLAEQRDITVPALYSRLGIHPLFSDTLDRDLTPSEVVFGITRMGQLLSEHAPLLHQQLTEQAGFLNTVVGSTAALSEEMRGKRSSAFNEISRVCEETLDISFHALALGKEPPPYDVRCPFPGLRAFHPDEQEFFFGREDLTERLRQRLTRYPFLVVLGASGSGKSSLVLAGLLPAIQKHRPEVQTLVMTPGNEPLTQLDACLAKAMPQQPLVLAVDQFEEIFTLCKNEAQRHAFLSRLIELIKQKQCIIITMRADFLGECAPYRQFKALVQVNQELISPLNTVELRQIMEQQSAAVGLRFEADLSLGILDDVQQEPGAMPLLQHTLLELWNHRHGRWLRAEEYRNVGGIQKAIAQTADRLYLSLSAEEQERMHEIFLRLTRPDLEARAGEERRNTRQRVRLEELVPAGSAPEATEATKALVKRLADARLVVTSVNNTTSKEEVEVAHEALIRYWPRLRIWLDEEWEHLRVREKIREAAQEWDQSSRDEGLLLLQGSRLQEAETLAIQPKSILNALEYAYVQTCREKQIRSERRRRHTRILFTSLLLLLVVVIIGASMGYAIQQIMSRPVSVTNLNDDGSGSLRDAIEYAQWGADITFATNLQGTIQLAKPLDVTTNITISGPICNKSCVTLKGPTNGPAFYTHKGAIVTIANLGIEAGSTQNCEGCNFEEGGTLNFGLDGDMKVGGAIFNGKNTTLSLINVIITGDKQQGNYAIFNNGTLTLAGCNISHNKAGGILNLRQLIVLNSTISHNGIANGKMRTFGGGINNWGGSFTLAQSDISDNTATQGGGIYNLYSFSSGNSTISTNHATEQGGGLFDKGVHSSTISYTTVYQNTAGSSGGGIQENATTLLQGSIVAGNTLSPSSQGNDIGGIAGKVFLAYPNLIQYTDRTKIGFACDQNQPNTCVVYNCQNRQDLSPSCVQSRQSIFNQDPKLGFLRSGAQKGNKTNFYPLLPGSPAIQKVLQNSPSSTFYGSICNNPSNGDVDSTIDQLGHPRPPHKGDKCDLGAVSVPKDLSTP